MRICQNCDNLLYPIEQARKLIYQCKKCHAKVPVEDSTAEENASNYCVSKTKYIHTASERLQVLQDVASDPTLPRAQQRCEKCGMDEAIFFQAAQTADSSMQLFFVCANRDCNHRWVR